MVARYADLATEHLATDAANAHLRHKEMTAASGSV